MSVNLRKKQNNDGTVSLYLDIYHNGKRHYQFLKELKLTKGTNPLDRQANKENLEAAKRIRNQKAIELEGQEHQIVLNAKNKIDFLEYFTAFVKKYTKKDKRVVISTLSKFKEFLKDIKIKHLTAKQVDEALVIDFRDYLEANLNGETPSNYFKKFKKVLKAAVREKLLSVNPATDISIKRKESVKKDILTMQEIQQVAATPMTNDHVKRAFLLSCFTGLRWCDVEEMRWRNIDLKSKTLSIVQAKTSERVTINLHETAIQLLGEAGNPNEKVFVLPSHTAATKGLKHWTKKAGINKKITWHCARHSFATNIIFHGADVNTASSLLGHTSLKYTQRYTRIVQSLKERAIDNLPAIKLQHEKN